MEHFCCTCRKFLLQNNWWVQQMLWMYFHMQHREQWANKCCWFVETTTDNCEVRSPRVCHNMGLYYYTVILTEYWSQRLPKRLWWNWKWKKAAVSQRKQEPILIVTLWEIHGLYWSKVIHIDHFGAIWPLFDYLPLRSRPCFLKKDKLQEFACKKNKGKRQN